MKNISDIIIEYIENNKRKNNIEYLDTIEYLKELLKELENDYKEL